jgi:hypothetical protein
MAADSSRQLSHQRTKTVAIATYGEYLLVLVDNVEL